VPQAEACGYKQWLSDTANRTPCEKPTEAAMQGPSTPTGRPLRAVLFDFDGTLADSYPAITASVNHVRALHELPPLEEAEVRRHVGFGPANLLGETVPRGDVGANVAAYRQHHPSVLRDGTRLLPGAAEALARLDARGLHLAVCSNKPIAFTRQLLDILGVAEHLDCVLGPEDVPHPKPAPDMLRTALERLNVPAAEALYVGDMVADIQTARAAGVTVWVVPTGSSDRDELKQARPDRLLHDLRELTERLAPA
jgi:phosphoglycolate phosphatase